MHIKEFDKATSRVWHVVFVLGYTFTVLLLVLAWILQTPPSLLTVLFVIECLGWQVFVYVRWLWIDDT